jgi:hypothetical protein
MSQKKELSLSIGQIVYILSNKQTIVPAMVIEENTIKTMEGKHISWKLALEKGEKQKVSSHEEIEKNGGEIFTNFKSIEIELNKRLKAFIQDLINKARETEYNWFGTQTPQIPTEDKPENKIDNSVVETDLDDDQKIDMREKLKKLATPSKEEMEETKEERPEGMAVIQMPDGSSVPVDLKQ